VRRAIEREDNDRRIVAGVGGGVVQASGETNQRVALGLARLHTSLRRAGGDPSRVRVGLIDDPSVLASLRAAGLDMPASIPPEGFAVRLTRDGTIVVIGSDPSGILYGCLHAAASIDRAGGVTASVDRTDAPVFTVRGAVIGMQKTFILPGRKVYEYPYTPELFPFFYDRGFWSCYLDFLLEQRFNALFLWNGHPFSSIVRVKGYEYAVEVDDEVFARNVETFHHLTAEADRRGIWVVQMFYSLLLPPTFAQRHGCGTQLTAPTPEAADYTRKALAEFVKSYPSVGVMACLGEALQGIENQKYWLNEVILPGLKDGMALAGLTEEPPVVIRTHATDLRQIMPESLKVYRNLYTEAKFNGESLTTWEPRGKRQQVHQAMSALGSTHMVNVHILANLEPFRYGSPRFIRRSMLASRDRLGARGLHLYPLAYWSWPDAPDAVEPPLQQIDRDWIWFEAWARYAWNPDIDESADRGYWIERLASMYGSADAAALILDAYDDSGECAPRLLRRFGITEGNRQTMSLGMTLEQLVDPAKHRPFEELWESQSPPGERLQEHAERAWKGQPHEGETPPQILDEVLAFSASAARAIDAAAPLVTRNSAEFARLRNDVHCIRAMSLHYAEKVRAAMAVLRHRFSRNLADMDAALAHLEQSVAHFRTLADLTRDTYRFANTMQTSQRRVPVIGGLDGQPANYHWTQLVPIYEAELDDFRRQAADLRAGRSTTLDEGSIGRLAKMNVRVLRGGEVYEVQIGARVFTDHFDWELRSIAPEILGLNGIRFCDRDAAAGSLSLEFEIAEPAYVLIGHVQSDDPRWRRPPDLETDAAADERGGIEPVIRNAVAIAGMPAVDVHALRFEAGRHMLEPRGTGSFLVLGIVPQTVTLPRRDARRGISDTPAVASA
jgi:hypothetical protein